MDIDINKLANDRAYWDEVAPEGAELYAPEKGVYISAFYKVVNGVLYSHLGGGDRWDRSRAKRNLSDAIPRPEPATEWDGEGLPPVGAKVEYYSECAQKWLGPLTVFHVSKKNVVFAEYDDCGEFETSKDAGLFRPIRTKAERDRDELCELASKYSDLGHVIADDILAAGWQKPN